MQQKPTLVNFATYSWSFSAPAIQPTQRSSDLRTSSGTSPFTTTSETANRPPGLSTRNASRNTLSLSAERLITQLEMITSTDSSGSGMFSISPFRNSAFSTPAFLWFSLARPSMSSVISSPYALPDGPTRWADSSTSIPPPEPRSRTVSPAFNSASAVGLPQPSDAFTAASGKPPFCRSSYKSLVIGSMSVPQADAPQQELAS